MKGARVYVHASEHGSEVVFHIDVDHPDLNRIILPKEASYVGGREGGVFIGLRPQQSDRAQTFVEELTTDGGGATTRRKPAGPKR